MVDHRYWGRGDKTKYVLSDGEVERLIALRDRWVVNAEQALTDWMAKEPLMVDKRHNAHLFVVADPVRSHERMLLDLFTGDYTVVFRELVSGTSHHGGQFQPDMPDSHNNFSTTTDGWAWKSYALFGQREAGEVEREDGALMVEICENGQIRMMCGRAASTIPGNTQLWLIDDLCLGLTARMVSLSERVSQAAGYMGSWDFGVGLTGLNGAISYSRYSLNHWAGPSYADEKYTATTRASLSQIEASTGPVVERLLGRLMRALGADQIESDKRHFT